MKVHEHYQTTKYQETLHHILVPLMVWIQTSIDLFGPLKEINGNKYIVIAVDYKSKFVEAEPLKEK